MDFEARCKHLIEHGKVNLKTLPDGTFSPALKFEVFQGNIINQVELKKQRRDKTESKGKLVRLDPNLAKDLVDEADRAQKSSTSQASSPLTSFAPSPNAMSADGTVETPVQKSSTEPQIDDLENLSLEDSTSTPSREVEVLEAMVSLTTSISQLRRLDPEDATIGALEERKATLKSEINDGILRRFISRNDATATSVDARDALDGYKVEGEIDRTEGRNDQTEKTGEAD